MSTATPALTWAVFNVNQPTLLDGSTSLISASLTPSSSDGSGYITAADDGNITVTAPQDTAVQITWLEPTQPLVVGGNKVTLTFGGITVTSSETGANVSSEFPVAVITSAALGAMAVTLPSGTPAELASVVKSTNTYALTSICMNNLVQGSWLYDYAITFVGSDGNTYIWDPTEQVEH